MICVVLLVGGFGCWQTLDEAVRDKVASEGASPQKLDETASAVKSEPASVSLVLEKWSMAQLWRFVNELLRKKGPQLTQMTRKAELVAALGGGGGDLKGVW